MIAKIFVLKGVNRNGWISDLALRLRASWKNFRLLKVLHFAIVIAAPRKNTTAPQNESFDCCQVGLGGLCSKIYLLFYSQIPILSPIILTNFTHYSHNFNNYSHNFNNYSHNGFIKHFSKVHNIWISLVIVLIHQR